MTSYPFYKNQSLSLLTDLYELTMAYGYWKSGMAQKEAAFHLFFRKYPFGGGFAIAAGLELFIDIFQNMRFTQEDVDYLETLHGADGKPLFEKAFLRYLHGMEFSCSIDAVEEGTLVFPFEPLVRVTGPILQAQLLESLLLNVINFQTLIATKAARICLAAEGDQVIEFGLRRAQGIDGAISATRAAFIGGCESTSNTLAGKLFGIPVKGTVAHSWIMAFNEEKDAFQSYAEALPNNCIFLVDTYDTVQGVQKAIQVGKYLHSIGQEMLGIRLDSGDLHALSVQARKMLDAAGFTKTVIVASNELEEQKIAELKKAGAPITVWGVGTHLVTAKDQPALDGVYKLSSTRYPGERWKHVIKLSEGQSKVSIPGILQVRRIYQQGSPVADLLYDESTPPKGDYELVPFDAKEKPLHFAASAQTEDLLKPIFRSGKLVYTPRNLKSIRTQTLQSLHFFTASYKDLFHPQYFPVGLEGNLHHTKQALIQKAKEAL